MHKFGWFPDGVHEESFEYSNVWTRERTTGQDRLVIAPRSNQIGLIRKLADEMTGPFLLLYVLVVTRGESELGRYEGEAANKQTLDNFLDTYMDFFEDDARHNLWIRAANGDMLIFDRHNLIYAYGSLETFVSVVIESGLVEVEEIRFPDPHSHHYHPEFDGFEKLILEEQSWLYSPLRDGDENPS